MPSGMDKDSLEAFRRQVEEDYRLDMGAIERLQRRFLNIPNIIPSSPIPSNPTSGSVISPHTVPSSFDSLPTPGPNSVDSSPTTGPNSFDSSPGAGSGSEWRTEQRSMVLPPCGPAGPHKDELVDSLRSMFTAVRR